MSSETITRNDLTAILNEVLPVKPSEYRTLLWTNSQGAQTSYTITANFSDYDDIEVVFERVGDLITKKMSTSESSATFRIVWSNYIVERTATLSGNTLTFGNGGYYGAYNSGSLTAGSSYAVPTKIYGIKYNVVAQPQEVADYIVEQGTSGIWTYRKWNSGIAECWGEWTSNSFAPDGSNAGWYVRLISGLTFPSNLFTATPNAFFDLTYWGTGYYWGTIRTLTKDDFQLQLFNSVNVANNGAGRIYAIGKWK